MRKYTTLHIARDSAILIDSPRKLNQKTAKLSDFEPFPKEPGFLYVTARAISSRVNANYDAWNSKELRHAYKSFVGRPVFVDHNNFDSEKSRGVILDAKIYEDKLASGHEDVWVELLIEVDAKAFPTLAHHIVEGNIDAVSMGADVAYTICSVCGNKAKEVMEYCAHIPQMKGRMIEVDDKVAGRKHGVLCYEDCYGVGFFEISFVFDPADESALISDKMLVSSNRMVAHLRLPREPINTYRERVTDLARVASKTADYPLMSLPDDVDTLRDEQPCPQCGAPDFDLICQNCGYEEAPGPLGDPNTEPDGVDMTQTPQPPEGQNQPAEKKDDSKKKDDDSSKKKDDSKDKKKDDKDKKKDDDSKDKKKDDSKSDKKDDSKKKDDKSKNDKSKSDKKEKKSIRSEGGKNVSRYAELAGQKTADVAVPPYHQETSPANTVTPYGTAGPEGAPTLPPEAPVDSSMGERATQTQIDPRSLGEQDVVAPVGQSEVQTVKGEEKPLANPTPSAPEPEGMDDQSQGKDEDKGQGVTAASKCKDCSNSGCHCEDGKCVCKKASREQLLQKALAHAKQAAEFRRQADMVGDSDVQNLDEPTPPAVDFGPDGHAEVLAPTGEGDQLQAADSSEVINDGRETGAGTPQERPQPPNSFNTVGPYGEAAPYGRPASKEDKERAKAKAKFAKARDEQRIAAASTRVLRIANFVDQRIALGLTESTDKYNEIARFEAMKEGELEGFIEATKELKKKQAKVTGRRIRVSAGRSEEQELTRVANRMPALGSSSTPSNGDSSVDDYLAFI